MWSWENNGCIWEPQKNMETPNIQLQTIFSPANGQVSLFYSEILQGSKWTGADCSVPPGSVPGSLIEILSIVCTIVLDMWVTYRPADVTLLGMWPGVCYVVKDVYSTNFYRWTVFSGRRFIRNKRITLCGVLWYITLHFVNTSVEQQVIIRDCVNTMRSQNAVHTFVGCCSTFKPVNLSGIKPL